MDIDIFNFKFDSSFQREDVIVMVPLQKRGKHSRTCTLNACLHRRRFCKQQILCTFTIPDKNVKLNKLRKWKKPQHKSVGCSQTKWDWSVINQQTGNLILKLRNKDWVAIDG